MTKAIEHFLVHAKAYVGTIGAALSVLPVGLLPSPWGALITAVGLILNGLAISTVPNKPAAPQ